MTISTLYYPTSGVNPLMISQSVNTSSNVIYDRTLTDLINEEGAIVAGNPFEYAATLHVPVGYVKCSICVIILLIKVIFFY